VSFGSASVASRVREREDLHLIAAIVAVFAWGIGPIFTRSMSVNIPTIWFYRMTIGAPLMTAMAYRMGGKLDLRVLRAAALPGILFAVSLMAGFASNRMTSIANATLLNALQPVLVVLVAPKLFGERLTRRQLLTSFVAVCGVTVVVLAAASTSGAHLSGDLLAVVNIVVWTGYFLLAKRVRLGDIHSWSFIAAVFVCAACVVVPVGAISSHQLGAMTSRDWLFISLMAVGPGLVGHGLMTWSQSHVDVTMASLLGLMSPVISTALAWIFLDQSLKPLQIAGAVVVLLSLSVLVRSQRVVSNIAVSHEA